MDYASIHGPGISNFPDSTPRKHLIPKSGDHNLTRCTDRMPTVSAAQALKEKTSVRGFISTGVPTLDAGLVNRGDEGVLGGGVVRGKVMEVWGPPGVGKTGLGYVLFLSLVFETEKMRRKESFLMRSWVGCKLLPMLWLPGMELCGLVSRFWIISMSFIC